MKRYNLSSLFLGVVLSAKIAFSERSWPYLATCAVPWLLCVGQRCVTRLAGLSRHRRSLSGYYRFLSDGKWRMAAAGVRGEEWPPPSQHSSPPPPEPHENLRKARY
jgi:hypothetical protein